MVSARLRSRQYDCNETERTSPPDQTNHRLWHWLLGKRISGDSSRNSEGVRIRLTVSFDFCRTRSCIHKSITTSRPTLSLNVISNHCSKIDNSSFTNNSSIEARYHREADRFVWEICASRWKRCCDFIFLTRLLTPNSPSQCIRSSIFWVASSSYPPDSGMNIRSDWSKSLVNCWAWCVIADGHMIFRMK